MFVCVYMYSTYLFVFLNVQLSRVEEQSRKTKRAACNKVSTFTIMNEREDISFPLGLKRSMRRSLYSSSI